MTPRLVVVTASTHIARARPCIESWVAQADGGPLPIILILNGQEVRWPEIAIPGAELIWSSTPEYDGSVRAFRKGVDVALAGEWDVIACLHDDFAIQEQGWDTKVVRAFARQPAMGLAGFGGAIGLGAGDMYEKPYDPMSLARQGFRSNLVDAEVHGVRSLLSERVACLDGFSQILRREFALGAPRSRVGLAEPLVADRPWHVLEDLGIVHHLYDGLLGALAARYGWETWYLPLRSVHYGGRTAVGDPGYAEWAKRQTTGGDQDFWSQAHALGYEAFRDVLPLRVP